MADERVERLAHQWSLDREGGVRCAICGIWDELPHARTPCRQVAAWKRRALARLDGEKG